MELDKMPVFHPNSLEFSQLNKVCGEMGISQTLLLEKCLLALELTGRLRQEGLNFIFKGGTSLLLHFKQPKRLSIDVDILCLDERAKLEEVLDRIKTKAPFTGWVHQDHRDREAPPTKHFKVFYNSVVEPGSGQNVQIDMIEAEAAHASIMERPIELSFAKVEEPVSVQIPTASSLLGDKLATLAPSTIGYPYQPIKRTGELDVPRPIKVAKHLFDVGELAMIADRLADTVATYRKTHTQQVRYRGVDYSLDDCLNDTQDVAFWTTIPREPKQEENKRKYAFMRDGIKNLKTHLIGDTFGIEAERNTAGRAALVAELIRGNKIEFDLSNFLNKEPEPEFLSEVKLTGEWKYLQGIGRVQPQAFACWATAQAIRNE